ncbi:MAG TPA: hypothetical protein VIV61_06415, partial [Candidatus Ozemobacteraceae bacterium]
NLLRSKESRKPSTKSDGSKPDKAVMERSTEKHATAEAPKPAAAGSPLTQASIDALPSKDEGKKEAVKSTASAPMSTPDVASGS